MKVTDNIQVFPNESTGTDIAGNVLNPANQNVLLPNTQSTVLDTTNPKGEGVNDVPNLLTPIIEAPIIPKGSGGSVVLEPEIGTPIVKDAPIQDEQPSQAVPTNSNPIKALLNTLPPFLGGGGGAGAGTGEEEATPIASKKPNYILYGGLLLAVIIAYKLLSKKEKKAN